MEKQTDKQLEDEIIEEVLKYFDTGKFSDYQLNYVKNIMFNTIKEARQGMIKIEDVQDMIRPLKYLVDNSLSDEGKKYAYNDMKNVQEEVNSIIKSLQKLEEKE
jgi:hypothetical protein